jgi:hypothetical protein
MTNTKVQGSVARTGFLPTDCKMDQPIPTLRLRQGLQMPQWDAWQLFSIQVFADFPFGHCHRQGLGHFLLGGRGCLDETHPPGQRATRETVAMVDKIYGARPLNPHPMAYLKNHITHELCVTAFSKAAEAMFPGIQQRFEERTNDLNNTISDIFLPVLDAHIEIKTIVWAGKYRHQHGAFQSSSQAVYCIFFEYSRAKVTVKSVGTVNAEVLEWVTRLANTCVLPAFLRWGEHLIHHSVFVREKREQGVQSDRVYTQESWPSIDSDTRFIYLD